MSDPSRRRHVLVGAVVLVFVGLLSGAACLSRSANYVVVPGADMHAEATELYRSLDGHLPQGADASRSLRGGFNAGSVITIVGVTDVEEQNALLARIHAARARGAGRFPAYITFHESVAETSRTRPDGSTVTIQRRGEVIRQERLD